jgi:hypothetical protein
MRLLIDATGNVRCVYTETIDLTSLGIPSIRRASHVEPDSEGQWWADLTPVKGPSLGPFSNRTQALQAEQEWLEAHWPNNLPVPLT